MRLIIVFLLVLLMKPGFGQFFPDNNYPKDYFRNPLNVPIDLAGNFGEMRPNHYHMGFDLKTQHRENLPVYAAADGYIAHIKIEPGGFGRAIYINHPNGFTTVYGHLNAFIPALDAYIKEQQYKQESWRLFLDLPPNLFPVKKGDFIAFSGNTGGSQGPHTHFEIRKTDDDSNRNPMLFGLPLADNVKPSISRLAYYDRRLSIYEQSPQIVPLTKSPDGNYGSTAFLLIVHTPKISFAITAQDTHTGSSNSNGIFEGDIYDNDKPVLGFQMDNISYTNTRNINAHIDYKTRANGGPYLQQLFQLPGYQNGIYKQIGGDGAIDIGDGRVHYIRIEVKDAYNNSTTLRTAVQYKWLMAATPQPAPGKQFFPLQMDGYETDGCEFFIGEKCLYDTVHIAYTNFPATNPKAVSLLHRIGAAYIPLQEAMLVRIKPTIQLDSIQKAHTVMQWLEGNKHEVQKVEWQKDFASARFRDLGNFQLVLDDTPPEIIPVGFKDGANLSKAARIVLDVKDNLEAFTRFRAELDGKWLRFTNDKGKRFIYLFDEKCSRGNHQLKIHVEDIAGNIAEKTFSFKR